MSEEFFSEAAGQFLRMLLDIRRLPVQKDARDLSAGENGLLLCLYMHPEGASAGQLSRELGIGTGAVANVMNALEGKGYIVRTMNPRDRRSVIAALSEQGEALIREKAGILKRCVAGLLTALGEEDTRALLRISQRILDISREGLRERA